MGMTRWSIWEEVPHASHKLRAIKSFMISFVPA